MIKIKYLNDKAQCPTRNTAKDAGLDLYASEAVEILPKSRAIIGTGIAISIPDGNYARIAPRSGLAAKFGIDIFAGVVDSSYRGEVKVILYNSGEDIFKVDIGDKIAQLIIQECKLWEVAVVTDLEETDRGENGFGSSGK